jgi:hypothetical protein
MNYYSYVISRDFGFAPNPFGEYCTLATCKPKIRKIANINDWVFGISPKILQTGNQLIFAMKVSQKLLYNDYWNSPLFQFKKPVMNGSLKQMYGDNIYFMNTDGSWLQADSHHSFENGEINNKNLNRDKKGEFVLIASEFYYFGKDSIEIPENLKSEFTVGIGHRRVDKAAASKVINWLEENFENGYQSDPLLFENFERYKG